MKKFKKLVKDYYKPFLLVFAIYLVAFFTLYRSQYFFADDAARAALGYGYEGDFNRFTANFIVHLIELLPGNIVSIAPFGQIFGFAVLAISCLMLVYLFTNKKPSIKHPIPLILSTFLALTPYMLNGWQYQFDTPWYTAAIFFAILPYALFWRKTPKLKLVLSNTGKSTPHLHLDEHLVKFFKIFIITAICNILVWTSWQIATGIFLSLGLAMIFQSFIKKEKLPWSDIITFILAYILATIFAYITTINMEAYFDTSIFPLPELIPGVINNIKHVIHIFATSFNGTWIIFSILSLLGLFLLNKFHTILFAILYIIIAIPVSIGPCLALQIFSVNGRSLIGPVVTLTILILMLLPTTIKNPLRIRFKPFLLAPTFLLLYSFIVHSWSYGNALTDQYRYEEARIIMLMQDLGHLYPTENLNDYILAIDGDIGLSPLMTNHFNIYPVSSYLYFNYMSGISHNNVGYGRIQNYYGRPQNSLFYSPSEQQATALTCKDLRETGITKKYETFFYTIYDTRSTENNLFPLDPTQLFDDISMNDLTPEELSIYNLTTKQFGVCIELNPKAKNQGSDQVKVYDGHLIQKGLNEPVLNGGMDLINSL